MHDDVLILMLLLWWWWWWWWWWWLLRKMGRWIDSLPSESLVRQPEREMLMLMLLLLLLLLLELGWRVWVQCEDGREGAGADGRGVICWKWVVAGDLKSAGKCGARAGRHLG